MSNYHRNDNGLIESVEYNFNEDGSVNWRSMIKPEFLYPNRDYFNNRSLPIPTSIEGLEDNQLLIKLGGIKELAKLRGFRSVTYPVLQHVSDGYVVAKCQIAWLPNFETEGEVIFEDVGNATFDNTDSFCNKFLETMACNRAFVRCVRNFLNIHIVGADEIDKSPEKTVEQTAPSIRNVLSPQSVLEKLASDKGKGSFEEFQEWLRGLWKSDVYKNKDAADWSQFSDIPAKEARILTKHLMEA